MYMHIYMCMCVYMFICMHKSIFICIHTEQTHTHIGRDRQRERAQLAFQHFHISANIQAGCPNYQLQISPFQYL